MGGYRITRREKLAEKFDIPSDAAVNQPRITVIGYREVIVCSHRGITEYSGEKICVATAKASVRITGLDLTIKSMDAETVSVVGQIIGIEFSY